MLDILTGKYFVFSQFVHRSGVSTLYEHPNQWCLNGLIQLNRVGNPNRWTYPAPA